LHEFTMYDIRFAFGTFTLYGTQIQLSDITVEANPNGSGRTKSE
jgi:hypothetical protein